jgi:hypothetical protein
MIGHASLLAALVLAACGQSLGAENPALPPAAEAPATARLADLQQQGGRRLLNGVPFTGTALDTYPDGARKARIQMVDGRAEGAWAEWYPDGAIRFYSEWRAGKGEGPFLYFHPNGEISERVTARADRWEGVAEGWHPDGRKAFKRSYREGALVSDAELPGQEQGQ